MIGLGSRLYYSTDNINFFELEKVKEISSPTMNGVEQIDETPLNPQGRRREYTPGLLETDVCSFKQFWTKDRYATLLPYVTNGQTLYWRVVAPDNTNPTLASRWQFAGNLKKWSAPSLMLTESMMIEAEIQLTADVTFTPGT
jgi:hypothetical protein